MKKFKFALICVTILCLMTVASTLGAQTGTAEAAEGDQARIGETYYSTLSAAFAAAVDGDTIYVQMDLSLSTLIPAGSLTGKNLTLTSEPGNVYTVTRGIAGNLFTLSGACSLTVGNICFDGAGNDASTHHLFTISSADSVVNILDGTEITKFKTTNTASVIQMAAGTLNMSGGKIQGNTADVGISAIYASNATVNLTGGEISGNSTGSSNGAIKVGDDVTVNIGGDIKIIGNTRSSSVTHNLGMGASTNFNVDSDFTGEVGVYSESYTLGAVFGTAAEGVGISGGKISNDRNTTLFGIIDGTNLKWGEVVANVTFNGVTTDYYTIADALKAASAAATSESSRATVTLIKDVTTDEFLSVAEKDYITLDLDGHTLDRGLTEAAENGYVIKVDGSLILTDSAGGGTVTGGFNTGNGGGILVGASGDLTVSSAEISGNTATNGGGVYAGGVLNISGEAVITDNYSGTAENNIYLPTGNSVNISDNDPDTTDDAFSGEIGVTMETAGAVVSVWSGEGTVKSDDGTFEAVLIEGEAVSLLKKYYVTYLGGGNDGGTLPADSTVYYAGDTFDAPDASGFSKQGYTFAGWSYGASIYAAGATVTFGDEDITLTAAWNLDKPTVNEGEDYSSSYDGEGHSISVSAEHGLVGCDFTYQWYKGTELIAGAESATLTIKNASDSGSYYCVVTASDREMTNSFQSADIEVEISPKSVTVEWDSDGFSYVYTGSAQSPSASAATGITGETLTLTVSGAAINASDTAYTATASTANGNYSLQSATQEFHITKASYDMSGITLSNSSYAYNGSAQSLEIAGTLPTGADGKTVTVSYTGSAKDVSDGSVTVTAVFATESTNYFVPAEMTAQISVTAKEITVTANNVTFKEGGEIVLSYTSDPLFDGDSFSGTLSISGTAAGKYPIGQGTLSAGSNYNITFATGAVCTVTAINLQSENELDADIEITDGVDPDAEFEITAIDESADERLSLPDGREKAGLYNAALTLDGQAIVAVGVITVPAPEGAADGAEYEIIYIENGQVVIRAATVAGGYLSFAVAEFGDILIAAKTPVQLAKEDAEDALNDYLADKNIESSEEVLEIIRQGVGAINGENFESIDGIIAELKAAIDLQLQKETGKSELDDYMAELTDPNDEVRSIIDRAKEAIDEAESETEITSIVTAAKADASAALEDDQKVLNLWWVIILLACIIFLELVAILLIFLLKRRGKKEKETALYAAAAMIIIPHNAITIIIILAVIAAALGAFIAYLLIKGKKNPSDTKPSEKVVIENPIKADEAQTNGDNDK